MKIKKNTHELGREAMKTRLSRLHRVRGVKEGGGGSLGVEARTAGDTIAIRH